MTRKAPLPCPTCAGTNIGTYTREENDTGYVWAECPCGTRGPEVKCAHIDQAYSLEKFDIAENAWNRWINEGDGA